MNNGVNPPRGKRSDFCKVSITLPPRLYQQLLRRVSQRKMKRAPDCTVSAVARDLLADGLRRSA
jgi:hypothetical protein